MRANHGRYDMSSSTISPATQSVAPSWGNLVAPYITPDLRRSLWQLSSTLILYFLLWYFMYRSLAVSYLLTLALAIPASGLLCRIFIFLHDCGHGSFFKSARANDFVGTICGILTFTPYFQWRHEHAIHHASSGDLERRGIGDVKTLTVKEYLSLTPWEQLKYRLYRHPLILFATGPLILFLGGYRFVSGHGGKRERHNIYLTNLALLAICLVMTLTIGFKSYLLVQLPICVFTASIAGWLFYIQHQFEDTYWERRPNWEYTAAALRGSSYYKLPKILQWFTGNIGLHHIHHLSPKIPNYYLQRCLDANPTFQQTTTITFWRGFKASSLKLWDEQEQKLISFAQFKRKYYQPAQRS